MSGTPVDVLYLIRSLTNVQRKICTLDGYCVGCKRSTHIFLSLGEAIRSENNRPNTVSMFKNKYVRKRPRKNGASRPSLIGRVLTWCS